jgi:uncharacterized protein
VKVAVHSLGAEPSELDATLSPQELGLTDEPARFDLPVRVRIKLTRMQEDILAQGEAHTTAHIECSRCLGPMALELAGTFEALYVPQEGAYGQRMGQRGFEWADDRVSFYSEGTIDLTDEIAQCLVIELPLKPLCRPDCAGLCPQCGQDFNEGACSCESDDEDDANPFAALRRLIPPDE